jgi:hypothetical protein
MSKKTKTITDDEVTPPLGIEVPVLAPAPEVAPAVEPEPKGCDATKADKACSLALGHAGHHHHVPSPKTIDALVVWS